jgi:hypothetical protein
MDDQEMRRKIAYLEFVNDQLISEMEEIDDMMRYIGFADGLDTVKETAWSLYQGDQEDLD